VPHTLTILPPTDNEDDGPRYTITCPVLADPDRACRYYEGCGCTVGPDPCCDQDGELCPRNPGQRHFYLPTPNLMGVPVPGLCWPSDCDEAADSVNELDGRVGLTPGTYLIDWDCVEEHCTTFELAVPGGAA
jgi:hypothetical protein